MRLRTLARSSFKQMSACDVRQSIDSFLSTNSASLINKNDYCYYSHWQWHNHTVPCVTISNTSHARNIIKWINNGRIRAKHIETCKHGPSNENQWDAGKEEESETDGEGGRQSVISNECCRFAFKVHKIVFYFVRRWRRRRRQRRSHRLCCLSHNYSTTLQCIELKLSTLYSVQILAFRCSSLSTTNKQMTSRAYKSVIVSPKYKEITNTHTNTQLVGALTPDYLVCFVLSPYKWRSIKQFRRRTHTNKIKGEHRTLDYEFHPI